VRAKTTLLDVLAQRVSMGVVTGDMLVSGNLSMNLPTKTGSTAAGSPLRTTTVREALRFSAMLRQPNPFRGRKRTTLSRMYQDVEHAGLRRSRCRVPGEGLNVEQRKLLTIVLSWLRSRLSSCSWTNLLPVSTLIILGNCCFLEKACR